MFSRLLTLTAPKLAVILLVLFGSTQLIRAQDYINGTGAPTFTTALPVELGFLNISNGNLHLEIPLADPPQRGPLRAAEKLVYDERMWSVVDNGTSKVWQANNQNAGWRFVHARQTGSVAYNATVLSCPAPATGTYTDYTSFVWTAPDGTKKTFPVETKSGCNADVSSSDALATDASGYHMWVSNFTQAYVVRPDGIQVYAVPTDVAAMSK